MMRGDKEELEHRRNEENKSRRKNNKNKNDIKKTKTNGTGLRTGNRRRTEKEEKTEERAL